MSKKKALITGSAKRIGREISLYLASKEYDLVLHYNKSEKEMKDLKSFLEQKYNIKVFTIQGDLEEESFLNEMMEKVKKKIGKNLDIIINNASVFFKKSFKKSSFEDWNKNFNINLKAPFFITKDYILLYKEGLIVNILDSKVNHNKNIEYTSYLLSKKALRDMTLVVAQEIAPGFRINGIAPGYVLKPFSEEKTESQVHSRIKRIPLQEKPKVSDIISSLEFLIVNKTITGQVIYIDGGEHL